MPQQPLICGIIAEFNPFHHGHALLMEKARQAGVSHIIAVMSGNFVQRGEPAFFSKWARAEMALRCGADLVADLPVPWALSSAEAFAWGGVSLLDSLGCVEMLAFGSECGDIQQIWDAALAVLSPSIQQPLRSVMASGATFAQARQKAIASQFGQKIADLFSSPNNILGIEYCKALISRQSSIRPFTISRLGSMHDDPSFPQHSFIASSSQIRQAVSSNQPFSSLMPPQAALIAQREILSGFAPATSEPLERAVLSHLRRMSPDDFAMLPDISEGLENRLYTAARNAESLRDFQERIKTKRYPLSRIRRLTWNAFLGITKQQIPVCPPYLHILGFSEKGRDLLKHAKITTKIPFLTNFSDTLSLDKPARYVIELEGKSADLFALATPQVRPCGLEWTSKILTVSFADNR